MATIRSTKTSEGDATPGLLAILERYAAGSATSAELEYTAELVLATAEEHQTEQDVGTLATAIAAMLKEIEFLDVAQLPVLAAQLSSALLGDGDDNEDSETDEESDGSRRRRLRKERLETQFAVGKSCLVVLEEDDQWHPARITKHFSEKESDEEGDSENESDWAPLEVEVEFIEFGKKQVVREDELVLDEDVAGREDADDTSGLCAMCDRPMNLTAHHLIPRVTHARYLRKGYTREFLNTCIMICRQCHSKIHSTEDNKTLAREFNTLDKIMQHPKIVIWVSYARKQKARVRPRKKDKWPVGK
ncbi:hypothetical protein BBJ28_00000538 [Nothophytophthora sp. Chile5]|nr:hypothetical protein BBJ28_00000538 [Nothophytophthora sp. Chile5]